MDDDRIIQLAADACRKAGADEWEVYLIEKESFSAESKNSELEAMETSVSRGLAIRVRIADKPGFSHTADFGVGAIAKAARAAVSGAAAADVDPHGGFAPPEGKTADIDPWDDGFAAVSQSDKIARAVLIEESARAVDKRIDKVRRAMYSETSRRVRMANNLGLERSGRATLCSASVMAVAANGSDSQSGWDVAHSATYGGLDCEAVGRRAATDAVALLGAKPIATCRAPVVLRNTAACDIIEVLSESFSGEAVAKGRSMLGSKKDAAVFSDKITIMDDPLLDGGAATFPFDGEGTPSRVRTLVNRGVLEDYLYDLPWARRAGVAEAGNAERGSYKAPPRPSPSNLYITPGETDLDDMLSVIDKGLLVAELMGVHTANPVTGDFSVGAMGWLIEGGKPTRPVQGVTIAGNVIELLNNVEAVGSDPRFIGSVGSPSLYVPSMDISGT